MSLFHRTQGLIRCLIMYNGRGDARNGPALLFARLVSGEQKMVEDEFLTGELSLRSLWWVESRHQRLAQSGQLQGRRFRNGSPGIGAGLGGASAPWVAPGLVKWHLSLPGCLSNALLPHRGGREA